MSVKITTKVFENSLVYIGAGYDFEPLLRLTNITQSFIYINLYLTKSEVERELHRIFTSSYLFEIIDKSECCDVAANSIFELDENYVNSLSNPDFMTPSEARDYLSVFEEAMSEPSWLLCYTIKRKDMDKMIKLYYFTAEGLATYAALSHNGKFAPKILCTIQTGVLEHPGGLMEKLLIRANKQPLLWIRGFEPSFDSYECWHRGEMTTLFEKGSYCKTGIVFNGVWTAFWSYQNQMTITRHCKGFMTQDGYEKVARMKLKPGFFENKNSLFMGSIEKNTANISDDDVLIIPCSIPAELFVDCEIIYWEDVLDNQEIDFLSCKDQFRKLAEALLSNHIKENAVVHIVPYCYEDQSLEYHASLDDIPNKTITYAKYPMDFFDLKE